MWNVPFLPEVASTLAGKVDLLIAAIFSVIVFFSMLVGLTIVFFTVRYHHRSNADRSNRPSFNLPLEIAWTVVPLVIALGIFGWSAGLYFDIRRAPADARDVYIIGKQWMWKAQHPEGQSEINEIHVPVGQAVRLTMTSQDVIHSLGVPAFRIKQDVLPGRYTSQWFAASKAGEYHLFCNQYCGTAHAQMVGKVIAMEPSRFQAWLAGKVSGIPSMSSTGQALFERQACATCHRPESAVKAPVLDGLFGTEQRLASGRTVTVDENYIRESIIDPQAKLVAGYQAVMPTYKGRLSEEELLQLVAYIKSLRKL